MKRLSYPGNPVRLFRLKRVTLAITLVSMVTGFLLVTQLRVQKGVIEDLSKESNANLGEIIRDLDFEVRALAKEEKDLELRLVKYEDSMADNQLIRDEAAANLDRLKKFIGLVEVRGSGIEINIGDEFSTLRSYDLADLINEIKSGSSEAIAVNGIRISANTPFFDDIDKGIMIGGENVSQPFKVEAIGDPETLFQVVGMLGGIKYTFTSYEGVTFDVEKRKEVIIPSLKSKRKD